MTHPGLAPPQAGPDDPPEQSALNNNTRPHDHDRPATYEQVITRQPHSPTGVATGLPSAEVPRETLLYYRSSLRQDRLVPRPRWRMLRTCLDSGVGHASGHPRHSPPAGASANPGLPPRPGHRCISRSLERRPDGTGPSCFTRAQRSTARSLHSCCRADGRLLLGVDDHAGEPRRPPQCRALSRPVGPRPRGVDKATLVSGARSPKRVRPGSRAHRLSSQLLGTPWL